MEAPEHILWVQTAFIGDVVLTTAAIKLAAEKFPESKQHLITTKAGADLLGDCPFLSSVHSLEKKKGLFSFLQVARDLKKKLGDLGLCKDSAVILQAHRSTRSSLLSLLLGYPAVTYKESSFSFFLKKRVMRIPVFHEAVRIALLLEVLGLPRSESVKSRPHLLRLALDPLAQTWEGELASFLRQGGLLIGIAPGSIWGTKRWPIESFEVLAAKILELAGPQAALVLIGSRDEATLTERIQSYVEKSFQNPPSVPSNLGLSAGGVGPGLVGQSVKQRIFNLAGKTSLRDLRKVVPNLALLVSNDSSPLHFASAFQVPTVALFGATTPAMGFGPLADKSISLGVEGLDCRPCSLHGPQVCPRGHFRCMKELSVEAVLEACYSLIF